LAVLKLLTHVPVALLPVTRQQQVAQWILAAVLVSFSFAAFFWYRRFRRWQKVVLWGAWGCLLLGLLMPSVARVREAGPQTVMKNRLKELVLAMHSAASHDPAGRPLLSWRVLLLPYLEEEELYRQFRLDEPWDSPHNLALLPRRPEVFAPPTVPGHQVAPSATCYQVFTGKGAAFEGTEGKRLAKDFPDGLDHTILVAEAGEPVPWTKPADLSYDLGRPLPSLGGLFSKVSSRSFWQRERPGFLAVFADGQTCFIASSTDEQTVRAVITRNGGEKVDLSRLD
jgi:hypothetical protein